MRVLHVTDFFPPVRGGLEGHVDDLASAQVARGHEVHVATLTPRPAPRDPRVRAHVVRAASRLLPHEDPDRPFPLPLPDPLARRDLARVLADVRPDVVHAHTWLGASVPEPVVLTAHDYSLVCQLRTLYRPEGARCGGPGAHCLPCGARANGWMRAALMAPATAVGRRLFHPDAVITLSQHVADTLRPFLDAPIDVCGGLLSPTEPSEVDLPDGPFALFAGDPGAHKGFDVLLDAWRELDVPLVVASTRARPAGVHVVSLDRGQMATAWHRAAVAVVPSRWDEPFGMVAMEALSAGTPVVASRVGALAEIVRDGVDGLLVPPGDPIALAAAVRAVLAERERFSSAARAGADRFAADAVVARVDAVYERVLGLVPR